MVLLYDELKKELNFAIPRRFNQECIENIFSRVKRSCGHRRNPTAYDILSMFK